MNVRGGCLAALAGTMAANFFYPTMRFCYFYAFAVIILALPLVFRARASVNDVARAGVILCLWLSIAFGAIYFPRALSDLDDMPRTTASLSFSDREVQAATESSTIRKLFTRPGNHPPEREVPRRHGLGAPGTRPR